MKYSKNIEILQNLLSENQDSGNKLVQESYQSYRQDHQDQSLNAYLDFLLNSSFPTLDLCHKKAIRVWNTHCTLEKKHPVHSEQDV